MERSFRRHDISDRVWELLPGRAGSWGGCAQDNRLFINGVFWILRTGAPWRDLPPDSGDWKNTHRRFCRWRDKGIWESILEKLINKPDFDWLMITPSHIKVHPRVSEGDNQDMDRTKGGSTRSFIWPWMRLVCRSELLSLRVPPLIVQKLSIKSAE